MYQIKNDGKDFWLFYDLDNIQPVFKCFYTNFRVNHNIMLYFAAIS